MKENIISVREEEIHCINQRLQILCEKLSDFMNENDLTDEYYMYCQSYYYRWSGVREFLVLLSRNELNDFLNNAELFVDSLSSIKDK